MVKIPCESRRDFQVIGYTWKDIFSIFENQFKIDRLVVIENYARKLNVPHLRSNQLKLNYKPKPKMIAAIAKDIGQFIGIVYY